jgi:hypothetical protein
MRPIKKGQGACGGGGGRGGERERRELKWVLAEELNCENRTKKN